MTNTIDGAQSCVLQDAVFELSRFGTPLSTEPDITGPEDDDDYGTCDFSPMPREDCDRLLAELNRSIPLYRDESDTPSVIAAQSLVTLLEAWIKTAF